MEKSGSSLSLPVAGIQRRPVPPRAQPTPQDAPPDYTEPSAALSQEPSSPRGPVLSNSYLPPVNFAHYHIPGSSLSKDGLTITVAPSELSSNPEALTRFIVQQAALPPKPEVRIVGVRDVTGVRKLDFDIRINMLNQIVRPPGPSSSWNYVKIVGNPSGGSPGGAVGDIATFADRLCRDPATNKTFILTREVINWNTQILEGRLRTLIASLNYQGRVMITFPSTHSRVVVPGPKTKNSFYTQIVSLFKDPKRYDMVRSIWPYANMAGSETSDDPRRVCAVQSENKWWDEWKMVIAHAIVDGRQGWVSLDDLIELAMSPVKELKAREQGEKQEWNDQSSVF
ncbi:hypothetical protein GTR04_0039 [Trichophyton interdigitale]|uniref:Uncharacterized protein n=1 Tax=Trichophyton interdigitale TaxID=101480 RepID=A0A9P5D0H3_9EURO|nr:hypothetical protein GY631_0987 [Trichophyton interdigitale]KAF3900974.1 hypothetical protein GY632_0370 [Trichophyton interdigitale]KAG8212553.1 hypothetical protein GTR04_0039 [Trichophyton interdigitale]